MTMAADCCKAGAVRAPYRDAAAPMAACVYNAVCRRIARAPLRAGEFVRAVTGERQTVLRGALDAKARCVPTAAVRDRSAVSADARDAIKGFGFAIGRFLRRRPAGTVPQKESAQGKERFLFCGETPALFAGGTNRQTANAQGTGAMPILHRKNLPYNFTIAHNSPAVYKSGGNADRFYLAEKARDYG